MNTIRWINTLPKRLTHILQISYGKEYIYNFDLANQATRNSIEMWKKRQKDHFIPLPPNQGEVIAEAPLDFGDEFALQYLGFQWGNSKEHSELLQKHNNLGIGFALDSWRNVLYATVRLG